jgi:hypothetical protein
MAMEDLTEDVTKMWERFNLLEEESIGIKTSDDDFEPLVGRGTACVMGKLLADRIVGKEVIKTPLIRAWQTNGRVSFKSVGINTFLIEFEKEWEKDRVMEGRPWTFDGDLVALVDFDGLTPPAELEFDKAAFWVRMYDLPLACMSEEMGVRIGSSVGKVEEVEVDEDGVGWGEYLRVRIILDLTKPISRGRFLQIRDKAHWVSFKYEKIPRFCFKCGTVRHGRRGCVAPGGKPMKGNEDGAQYGPWLRASLGGIRRNMGRERRREGVWRSNAPVANQSLSIGDSGAQGERGVAEMVANGGVSSGTAGAPVQSREGNFVQTGKVHQYFNASGISGEISSQVKETISPRDSNVEKRKGQLFDTHKNDGASNASFNDSGDMVLNKTISQQGPKKGKSVYVGQWDSIKEKMVWESMEKVGDVAGLGCNIREPDHVEKGQPISGFNFSAQERVHGKAVKSGRNMVRSRPKGQPAAHKGRRTGPVQVEGSKDGEKEMMGKRKAAGAVVGGERSEGKRYRLVDEREDEWSDNEAEAAEQPRHAQ